MHISPEQEPIRHVEHVWVHIIWHPKYLPVDLAVNHAARQIATTHIWPTSGDDMHSLAVLVGDLGHQTETVTRDQRYSEVVVDLIEITLTWAT